MRQRPGGAPVGRTIATLALTETVSWGVLYYAFAVLLAPMAQDTAWSVATLSGAFSLALEVTGLSAPFVGRAVDARGARAVMTAGSLLGVAAALLWSVAATPAWLYAAWALMGLAMSATLYEPAFAAIVRHHRDDRRRAILVVTLVAALAATVFQPAAHMLAGTLGWRQAVRVLALLLGAITVPAHALWLPRHDAGQTAASAAPAPRPRTAGSAAPRALLPVLTAGFGVSGAVTVGLTAHLVAFLLASGASAAVAAGLSASVGVAKLVGRVLVTALVRHVSAPTLTAWMLVVQGLAVLVGLVGAAPAMVAHVALFGAASGAITVLRPWTTDALVPPERFGEADGRMQRVSSLGKAAAPAVAGLLFGWTGGYHAAWAVAAVTLLAVGALVLRARRSRAPCQGSVFDR